MSGVETQRAVRREEREQQSTWAGRVQRARHWLVRSVAEKAEQQDGPPSVPLGLGGLVSEQEDRVSSALLGTMSFAILKTAHRVGVFAELHHRPDQTLDELAEALALEAYPLHVILVGLGSQGLVEKIDGRYRNNAFLSAGLAGAAYDGALGKLIEYMDGVINPAMEHLEASVREGRPVGLEERYGGGASFYEVLSEHPVDNDLFQTAMRADTGFNRERVARDRRFAERRILDVGGNVGELALAIARNHPGARVTTLDYPAVAEKARARFAESGFADRLDAVGADVLHEPFPTGFDCVLFGHFIDIFSPDEVRDFFRRARFSLEPGGFVRVFGSVLRDDESGPVANGLLSAYFLALADGKGRIYTVRETSEALRAAGFRDVRVKELPKGEAVIDAFLRREGQ